jgi:hypothetical protein
MYNLSGYLMKKILTCLVVIVSMFFGCWKKQLMQCQHTSQQNIVAERSSVNIVEREDPHKTKKRLIKLYSYSVSMLLAGAAMCAVGGEDGIDAPVIEYFGLWVIVGGLASLTISTGYTGLIMLFNTIKKMVQKYEYDV